MAVLGLRAICLSVSKYISIYLSHLLREIGDGLSTLSLFRLRLFILLSSTTQPSVGTQIWCSCSLFQQCFPISASSGLIIIGIMWHWAKLITVYRSDRQFYNNRWIFFFLLASPPPHKLVLVKPLKEMVL